MKKSDIKTGAKIRASFTGTITSEPGEYSTRKAFNLTNVRERDEDSDGNRWNHRICLADRSIIPGQDYGSLSQDKIVTISLTGTIVEGTPDRFDGAGVYGCYEVLSDRNFTHYLYLESDSVTLLEDSQEGGATRSANARKQDEGTPATGYAPGDLIRFRATVTNTGGIGGYTSATDQVTQVDGEGEGFRHYLYRGEAKFAVPPSGTGETSLIDTVFMVTSVDPGTDGCVAVRLNDPVPGFDYTHYLYLGSPSVTRFEEPVTEPELEVDMTTGAITPEGEGRLLDLAGKNATLQVRYSVVRKRDGEVKAEGYATIEACRSFLNEEDLDISKFRVEARRQRLELEERQELRRLLSNLYSDLYN